MGFFHPSATEWARDHSLAADVRFGRLEAHAFQRHPEVYRWFGVDGAAIAERTARPAPTSARRLLVWLTGIVAVIGIAAPIAAVAVLSGDRFQFFRMDADTSVPTAGVFFVIAALTQLTVLVLWVVRGARWDGFVTGIVVVAAVFSVFGLVAMPNTAAFYGFAGWEAWYPPVVVSAVVSIVSVIAMFARFRVRAPEALGEGPAVVPAGEASTSAAAAIAALPAGERDAIAGDRDAALEILHERGILDEATLERALATDLGALFQLDDAPGGTA